MSEKYTIGEVLKDELGIEWTVTRVQRGEALLSSDDHPNAAVIVDCYGRIRNHPHGWVDIFLEGAREHAYKNYHLSEFCKTCLGSSGKVESLYVWKPCECTCETCGGPITQLRRRGVMEDTIYEPHCAVCSPTSDKPLEWFLEGLRLKFEATNDPPLWAPHDPPGVSLTYVETIKIFEALDSFMKGNLNGNT